MRKTPYVIVTLFLFALIGYALMQPQTAGQAPAEVVVKPQTAIVPEVWEPLAQFVATSQKEFPGTLGAFAGRLEKELPEIRRFCKDEEFGQGDLIQLDVIYQNHAAVAMDSDKAREVKASQERIYQTLLQGHYDLIAHEGMIDDTITPATIRTAISDDIYDRAAAPFGLKLLSVTYEQALQNDATLRFATEHPETRVLGCENRVLHQMNYWVNLNISPGLFEGVDLSQSPFLKSFRECCRVARSQYALARIVHEARKTKAKKCALVIGALHDVEIPSISSRYLGVRVTFRNLSGVELPTR